MLLVGDIGATNTRVAIFENLKTLKIIKEEKFKSKDFASLLELLSKFLKNLDVKIKAACFGVAGPIINNSCKVTNLDWYVDAEALAKELKISKVYLINDLVAYAYGINILSEKDFFVLNKGVVNPQGNSCIIAAGTGLGEAIMMYDGKNLIPYATEGGHCDFAPQNEIQIELLKFLMNKFESVAYETVLSGRGIYYIYQFLVENKSCKIENNEKLLENELSKSSEPQIVITQKAIMKESKICQKVLDIFISIYGAEASNLALKCLATSGVYIGGGIAPKIINLLKDGSFYSSFINKGNFKKLLENVPIKVILNEKSSLFGCVRYMLQKNE